MLQLSGQGDKLRLESLFNGQGDLAWAQTNSMVMKKIVITIKWSIGWGEINRVSQRERERGRESESER